MKSRRKGLIYRFQKKTVGKVNECFVLYCMYIYMCGGMVRPFVCLYIYSYCPWRRRRHRTFYMFADVKILCLKFCSIIYFSSGRGRVSTYWRVSCLLILLLPIYAMKDGLNGILNDEFEKLKNCFLLKLLILWVVGA